MKEYKLPEEWYIEITDENKQILNDWKIQQPFNQPIDSYKSIKYVTQNGGRDLGWLGGFFPYSEITTNEFIQYVLKQDVFPKNWAIRQNACQEACDWLNDNYREYVERIGKATIDGTYAYIAFQGKYIFELNNLENYVEITKEQFIKHVLKEKHDYSKLINILKFIDESSRM
jgi:hypothetical protein